MCVSGCNRDAQKPPDSGAGAACSPGSSANTCSPVIEIEIVDASSTVISGKQTVRVGERVTLRVRSKTTGATISNPQWTIPGNIVKKYEDDASTAVVTPVQASDRTQATVEFYWIDKGNGRSVSVTCACSLSGTTVNKSASVTFDVAAPTLDKFDSSTDAVGFDDPAAPARIQFGLAGKSGIKWKWKVTVPAGVDGWVKDVQTIRTITKREAGGKKQVWTVPGTKVPPTDTQLDTTNPYSQPGDFHATKGFPQKVMAGASYLDDYTSDGPGGPLGGTVSKSYDDHFSYYIMYKPDTADAIWVPVAVARWYWKGQAKLVGGNWTLPVHEAPSNPSGSATTEFPVYSSNVSNNTWQDE